MKFWDSSAVIPLLIHDVFTHQSRAVFKKDPEMLVWALTPVECLSAIYRCEREKRISQQICAEARALLKRFEKGWMEIIDMDAVKRLAGRMLAVHILKAADALQLAAALVAFGQDIEEGEFVTFDDALARAAEREGLKVLSGEKND